MTDGILVVKVQILLLFIQPHFQEVEEVLEEGGVEAGEMRGLMRVLGEAEAEEIGIEVMVEMGIGMEEEIMDSGGEMMVEGGVVEGIETEDSKEMTALLLQ
ncbi:hypothetical protein J6590_035151 [Homalodisca vitripennis]|nr:hypothetical protein J6590_035151 [Homalodisca vitripennis]